MNKTVRNTILALVLASPFVFLATRPGPNPRIVEHGWYRKVQGVAVIASGKRVFWPVDKATLNRWIEQDGGDPRWWAPRNCEHYYWALLDTGEVRQLGFPEWCRSDKGSEVARSKEEVVNVEIDR